MAHLLPHADAVVPISESLTKILGVTEERSGYKNFTVEKSPTYDEVFLATHTKRKETPPCVNDKEERNEFHSEIIEDGPRDPSSMWEEAKQDPLAELDLDHLGKDNRTKMHNILNKYKSLYDGTLGEVVAT